MVGFCKKRVAQFTCWDWSMFKIEKKLTELNFPVRQRKLIQVDIFGGPAMGVDVCLYDCESEEDFNQK